MGIKISDFGPKKTRVTLRTIGPTSSSELWAPYLTFPLVNMYDYHAQAMIIIRSKLTNERARRIL
jgi:hypothetical protein